MDKKYNEVTCFMYYMYNKWSLDESKALFGENLGLHIYNKYAHYHDSLRWYAELDTECRQKLVDRANEIYKSTTLDQYKMLKEKHPDAILLFRNSDFYKLYEEDSQVASQILGITLHVDKMGKGFFCEFPHHALDTYLPKLIRAGKRVAICENL